MFQLPRRLPSMFLVPLLIAMAAPSRAQAPDDCGTTILWGAAPAPGALSGWNIDQDGTVAVAGSGGTTGNLTIWRRAASGWTVDALVPPPSSAPGESYGFEVSIDGQLMAATFHEGSLATGTVLVHRWTGSEWQLDATFESEDAYAPSNDQYGYAHDLSGQVLVVGSADGWSSPPVGSSQRTGVVYAYERGPMGWQLLQVLSPASLAGANRPYFGYAVAIQGDRLVVGARAAPDEACPAWVDCSRAGMAYVYERGPTGWELDTVLHASDASPAAFGFSVALDGDRIVVGAPQAREDRLDPESNRGAAYVFDRQPSGEWLESAQLRVGDMGDQLHFATSVSLRGDDIVVGRSNRRGVPLHVTNGMAFLWHLDGGTWTNLGMLQEGTDGDAYSWGGVVLAGDTIMASAGCLNDMTGGVYAHVCPSLMSADVRESLDEPSAIDLRVAPPLDLRLSGNFLVLGWEETMGEHTHQLQVGTLLSLWRSRVYDHGPIPPCANPNPGATVELPHGDVYFLVISLDGEGVPSSYGRDSFGRERPAASVDCP